MMRAKGMAVACLLLALAGCGGGTMERDADGQEILEADRAFSRLSGAEGISAAFTAYMADDAVIYRDGTEPIVGADAIRAAYAGVTGGSLTWEPSTVDVADSGDLGWTRGSYLYRGEGEDGEPFESRGFYVSIWRRQADGSWKYVFDSGIRGPAPAEAAGTETEADGE